MTLTPSCNSHMPYAQPGAADFRNEPHQSESVCRTGGPHSLKVSIKTEGTSLKVFVGLEASWHKPPTQTMFGEPSPKSGGLGVLVGSGANTASQGKPAINILQGWCIALPRCLGSALLWCDGATMAMHASITWVYGLGFRV